LIEGLVIERLQVEVMSAEAVTTSAIEGEILNRDSLVKPVGSSRAVARPVKGALIRTGERRHARYPLNLT
jgi:hypothetical protein